MLVTKTKKGVYDGGKRKKKIKQLVTEGNNNRFEGGKTAVVTDVKVAYRCERKLPQH